VLTVEFTVVGIPVSVSTAVDVQAPGLSLPIATENQEERTVTERDRRHGGTESQCGWCKDRWGSPGRSPRR
jgi:predicted 3-demethylubiquinone-9 3-methyltransferase (glyoxalase superfamily)